jgi:hypothetical protein
MEKPELTDADASKVGDIMACIAFAEGVARGVEVEASYANSVTGKPMPRPFCLSQEVEKWTNCPHNSKIC